MAVVVDVVVVVVVVVALTRNKKCLYNLIYM